MYTVDPMVHSIQMGVKPRINDYQGGNCFMVYSNGSSRGLTRYLGTRCSTFVSTGWAPHAHLRFFVYINWNLVHLGDGQFSLNTFCFVQLFAFLFKYMWIVFFIVYRNKTPEWNNEMPNQPKRFNSRSNQNITWKEMEKYAFRHFRSIQSKFWSIQHKRKGSAKYLFNYLAKKKKRNFCQHIY